MLFEKIFSSISTILRPSYSEVQNDNVTTKIIDKIFECYYFNNFTNVILLEYNLDQYNSDKITKNLAIIPYNITILDKSKFFYFYFVTKIKNCFYYNTICPV